MELNANIETRESTREKVRAAFGLDMSGALDLVSRRDYRNIDAEAADLARRDLAAGRVAASALGATIERYAAELGERRKDEKAAGALFNSMLRGEM